MPWPFKSRKKFSTASGQSPQDERVALPAMAGNRRFMQNVPYMLPKDLGEINRLDFQHYVLRATLKGNFLAPLQNPTSILDVGCGSGQWCYEMCAQFPSAQVTGFDLEAGKAENPPHYRFVAGNVLDGLPFPDASFDYVHQRLLVTALPLTAWTVEVKELARVTRPGGWVELVEGGSEIAPAGPSTQRLFELMSQLAAIRGLDTSGVVARSLDDYLYQAGLQAVEKGIIDIPLGQWGGRIGGLMSTNFRTTFTSVRDVFQARFRLPAEEFDHLVAAMQQEWEQHHTIYRFRYAYGQKS
ncbi:MAG TPA: methyltransferase domain-containing protein [Ktedonobacteraceae bacterium]|nr:methyltransferase domain-containing protein [Ktedonobacteraceae bacterium]